MEEKDAAFALAKNVVNINYDDIPEEVVKSTKKSILDTLGVLVTGSGLEPGCRRVVELVKEVGAREESVVPGEIVARPQDRDLGVSPSAQQDARPFCQHEGVVQGAGHTRDA